MSSSNLLRLGGLAAVIGGVLFAVSDLLSLLLDFEDPLGTTTSASYALGVGLALISSVLLTGGLVGIYAARSEVTGVLGLIGFALAFAGEILAAGGTWSDAFVTPALAQEVPELLLSDPPGIVMFGNILSFGLLTVGWLIFGAALLRARAYPRVATVLVLVGAVVQALPFLPPAIGVPGAVVFDVGVAWLGFALLTGAGASTEQQALRVR
jgi:uncharacterized membrane protein (UPF0136 family)